MTELSLQAEQLHKRLQYMVKSAFLETQVSSWHNNQTHFWRQQPGQWYETRPSPNIYHLWSTTFFGKGNSCDPTRTVNPHHLAESWSSPSSLIQLRSRALVMWRWVCCSVWRDVLSASSLKLHKKTRAPFPELQSHPGITHRDPQSLIWLFISWLKKWNVEKGRAETVTCAASLDVFLYIVTIINKSLINIM